MNYSKAIKILELDINEIENPIPLLKKQYHKLALWNHPDKNNNTEESKICFQEINEAYQFLTNHFHQHHNTHPTNENEIFSFQSLLTKFIHIFFQNSDHTELVYTIISKIINQCENITVHIFDGLNKELAYWIYTFILNNKKWLHFSNDKLDTLWKILLEKYNHTDYYVMQPTLEDMFESKVYKLVINEVCYIVPLWHTEITYDNTKTEINVLCNPILPNHITIDEENNIIMNHVIPLENICTLFRSNEPIVIPIYEKKNVVIGLKDVTFRPCQQIVLFQQGIPKIKNDIYDVDEKSNIIIYLSIQ